MNNSFKLIITEEAVEFSQESLQIFQDFNICTAFCVKDGEELTRRCFYGCVYDKARRNRSYEEH